MREIFGMEYLTLREAAKAAGVSPARLYTLRREGALHAIPMQTGARWEYHTTAAAVLDALNAPTPKHAPVAMPQVDHRTLADRDAEARARLRTMGLRV